ncbi:MAG: DMT family transporter [Alphaproteobacteria bacterium TMED89]|nr:EamA family transporter [Rhodospirillaceae bacterium]RPH10128.1 MAG: DMT family transporter [Alphaproteobacteria bacterium TMED89]
MPTLLGFGAILLWAALALLTSLTTRLPLFEWLALTFGLATLFSLPMLLRPGTLASLRAVPVAGWALGIGGLFGYHALYMLALKNAPTAQAGLIAYLWPLLIVLFSMVGFPLSRWMLPLLGGVLGLVGAGLLVFDPGEGGFRGEYALGYGFALACALMWSSYSVLNRRFSAVPTAAVVVYCAAAAVGGLILSRLFEPWVTPTALEWVGLVGLALGPMGLAFFVWDFGTKHGNVTLLGALSYFAPLLSTVLLVLTGRAAPSWALAAATVLIVGGAGLAALGLRQREGSKIPD